MVSKELGLVFLGTCVYCSFWEMVHWGRYECSKAQN
jgi:hypothetical protein